jgi:hypothetical protein
MTTEPAMHETALTLRAAEAKVARARAALEAARVRWRRAKAARDAALKKAIDAGANPHMIGPTYGLTGTGAVKQLKKLKEERK